MNAKLPKLLPGERIVNHAPVATLPNGQQCVPQHYFEFEHSLTSVEAIVADIDFDPRYLLFVAEEAQQLYVQVGIIGPDNYRKTQEAKIVYGRKWRIERDLPTSEVIQTCFLALQKAREHEIRERLVLEINNRNTTPFNNHHDLPLMASHAELLQTQESDLLSIEQCLTKIRYDNARFALVNKIKLSATTQVVELNVTSNNDSILEEVQQQLSIHLILEQPTFNHFLSRLMEQLVLCSNRYVAENFCFKGFARFSEKVSVTAIANLSSATRIEPETQHGTASKQKLQYDVDENRVPFISPSLYSERLKEQLARFGTLQGFLPVFQDQ